MAEENAGAVQPHMTSPEDGLVKPEIVTPASDPKSRTRRPPRPNYAKIHAKPLPLEVVPLPAFVPHNPLSLFRILYALVSEVLTKPSSPDAIFYIGHFSPETRSVHVTNFSHARALWEMGFFGKGSLSRSEPSWLEREKARRKAGAGGTSEEATSKRREERRMFKLERARVEREAIEEQLRREGKTADLRPEDSTEPPTKMQSQEQPDDAATDRQSKKEHLTIPGLDHIDNELDDDAPVIDQEHLQLNLCEALFLAYGLGVLSILPSNPSSQQDGKSGTMSSSDLLTTFACHSLFPPCTPDQIRPDNPFLLSYVVYHHYRSLGWVVRPGSKFAVDWLLYNRGPVFSHAEFAVIIVPEYPDGHNSRDDAARSQEVAQKKWWEFHCTNRVQSQVRKTLVVCYVEVPREIDATELRLNGAADHENNTGSYGSADVGRILRKYRVREFVVRRWLANRSRD